MINLKGKVAENNGGVKLQNGTYLATVKEISIGEQNKNGNSPVNVIYEISKDEIGGNYDKAIYDYYSFWIGEKTLGIVYDYFMNFKEWLPQNFAVQEKNKEGKTVTTFNADIDEQVIVGKPCKITIEEEEYTKKDGTKKMGFKVVKVQPAKTPDQIIDAVGATADFSDDPFADMDM